MKMKRRGFLRGIVFAAIMPVALAVGATRPEKLKGYIHEYLTDPDAWFIVTKELNKAGIKGQFRWVHKAKVHEYLGIEGENDVHM